MVITFLNFESVEHKPGCWLGIKKKSKNVFCKAQWVCVKQRIVLYKIIYYYYLSLTRIIFDYDRGCFHRNVFGNEILRNRVVLDRESVPTHTLILRVEQRDDTTKVSQFFTWMLLSLIRATATFRAHLPLKATFCKIKVLPDTFNACSSEQLPVSYQLK